MFRSHGLRLAVAICAVLVAAACGQKPGLVSDQGVTLAGAALPEGTTLDAEGNLIDETTGEVLATAEELAEGTTTTSDFGDTTTTTDTSNDNTDTTDPGTDDPDDDGPPVAGGDSTGVTDDTIMLGAHAPITGAAPVPSDSANKGAKIYWEWLKHKGIKIHGRDVNIVLRNDNYNPSQAVAVCRQMVEDDKVFMLSGAAGTDQIQACARYANGVGVPYLSSGVTELALTGLPTYFAVSMTYPDQQPLLADMIESRLGGADEKNGMVWFNTATFQDGHEAFATAMEDRGMPLDFDRAISKTAGASEAQAVVTDLRLQGIENVNLLLAPVFFLQMLSAAGSQNYHPQWVAAGVQMTFNAVATAGCQSQALEGAKMFAPFPAWVDSDKYDPEFRKAVRELYPDPDAPDGDDFMWLGWSGAKALHAMLEQVGPNLTRERFIYALERSKNLFNGIGPHLSFTPDDHFGADETHVHEAKCSVDRRWHTIDDWVKEF